MKLCMSETEHHHTLVIRQVTSTCKAESSCTGHSDKRACPSVRRQAKHIQQGAQYNMCEQHLIQPVPATSEQQHAEQHREEYCRNCTSAECMAGHIHQRRDADARRPAGDLTTDKNVRPKELLSIMLCCKEHSRVKRTDAQVHTS